MKRAHWTYIVALSLSTYAAVVVATNCTPSQRRAAVHAATDCRVIELPPPICVSPVDAVLVLAELVDADREDRDAVLVVSGPDGERTVTVPRLLVRAAADGVRGAL
jgi:hypothetical protein